MARPSRQLPSPDAPDAVRYIRRPRLRCRGCGSTDMRVYKTLPEESDGSRTRYVRCLRCRKGAILLEE